MLLALLLDVVLANLGKLDEAGGGALPESVLSVLLRGNGGPSGAMRLRDSIWTFDLGGVACESAFNEVAGVVALRLRKNGLSVNLFENLWVLPPGLTGVLELNEERLLKNEWLRTRAG